MKRFHILVRGHTLTLLFGLALCLLVAAAVMLRQPGAFEGLLAAAVALLLFVAWRVLRFRARLLRLLRQMVAGDFDVGLPGPEGQGDEVSAVGGLVNRLAELVRNYDDMRTRRIRQLRMMLQMVLDNSGEPMMLYDATKETLECNAPVQGIGGTGSCSVSLAELQRSENGKALADILAWVVKQEKSPWGGNMTIQLPGQEETRQMYMRILPFKDKDGSVPMAVVFGKMAEQKAG